LSAHLEQRPDAHLLALDEHRVTQLLVELGAVRLQTWTLHDAIELRVGVPFTIRQADGDARRADPAEPEQLAPLLTLVGRRLEVLRVGRDASLVAGFSDGTVLEVHAHARHEAWQLQGAGGLEGLVYLARAGGGRPWEELA
jgi:hypothetical protein